VDGDPLFDLQQLGQVLEELGLALVVVGVFFDVFLVVFHVAEHVLLLSQLCLEEVGVGLELR
jgi:hypothetical protein